MRRRRSFSPDGQKIAFSHIDGASGNHEIWIMNADGSGQTPLDDRLGDGADFAPDFSPDGQRIAFDQDSPARTRPSS